MQVESARSQVQQLLRQVPFRPFLLTFNGGEVALIGHPENLAFNPEPGGSTDLSVITGGLRMFSSFDAISSITLLAGGLRNGAEQKAAP